MRVPEGDAQRTGCETGSARESVLQGSFTQRLKDAKERQNQEAFDVSTAGVTMRMRIWYSTLVGVFWFDQGMVRSARHPAQHEKTTRGTLVGSGCE